MFIDIGVLRCNLVTALIGNHTRLRNNGYI